MKFSVQPLLSLADMHMARQAVESLALGPLPNAPFAPRQAC